MAAQPLRPDIANPPPIFVLAGLPIGALPAIPDGAVEHAAEKGYFVEQQALHGVKGSHELKSSADAEQACVQLAEPAERTVFPPGHQGAMVIPDQKICVRADGTYRGGKVYASAHVGSAAKDFAQ